MLNEELQIEEWVDPVENEQCGRCGCRRKHHVPVCSEHANCKRFSAPKTQKPKGKAKRR